MSEISEAQKPSTSLTKASAGHIFGNFALISDVFQRIEEETAEMAEMIFDYLVNVGDEQIMTGTIPAHKNKKVNAYIKILNRLFLFSRKSFEGVGIRVINRKTIHDLDKKTFTICMCHDGGTSLDILCDIVNVENQARTPKASPVKITIRKMSGEKGKTIS